MLTIDELKAIRAEALDKRSMLGPRGTITEAGKCSFGRESFVQELLNIVVGDENDLWHEAVACLGEFGGELAAHVLSDFLQVMAYPTHAKAQQSLIEALTSIGGPLAVEALLYAAENYRENIQQSALAGLEALASFGAPALTEAVTPRIPTLEEKPSYEKLAERLESIAGKTGMPKYTKHCAEELAEMIRKVLVDSA